MREDYPTHEELERIKHWPIGDWIGFAEYVCSIWHYGHPWARIIKHRDGTRTLRLATGGWSGNESIVSAVDSNMFGFSCWQKSERGGLHVYKIPATMLNVKAKDPGKSGCIRE